MKPGVTKYKAVRQGPKGVKMMVDVDTQGGGQFDIDFRYRGDTKDQADTVMDIVEQCTADLDGFIVQNQEDAKRYAEILGRHLYVLITADL